MTHRDGHTLEIYIDGDAYERIRGDVNCPFPKPDTTTDTTTWPACWRNVNTKWVEDADICIVQEWYREADSIWTSELVGFNVTEVPVPLEWWNESDCVVISPYRNGDTGD